MQEHRKIRAASWGLVLSPLVLLCVFLTLAAHVRIGLGHWPVPMVESYRSVLYRWHDHLFLALPLLVIYGSLPLWLLSLAFRVFRISWRTHLLQAGVYALGWAVIALYCRVDPWRFVDWYVD